MQMKSRPPATAAAAMQKKKLKNKAHYNTCDSRLVKQVVFGMVDGTGIRGRSSREWVDDVKDWCQVDMHTASNLAQSR